MQGQGIQAIFYVDTQQYGYNRIVKFHDQINQFWQTGKRLKLHHELAGENALTDQHVVDKIGLLHQVTHEDTERVRKQYQSTRYVNRDKFGWRTQPQEKIDKETELRLLRPYDPENEPVTYFTVRADLNINSLRDLQALHDQTIAILKKVNDLINDPEQEDWRKGIIPGIDFKLTLTQEASFDREQIKACFLAFLQKLAEGELPIHWQGLSRSNCVYQTLDYTITDSSGASILEFNPCSLFSLLSDEKTSEEIAAHFHSPEKSVEEVKQLCALLRQSPNYHKGPVVRLDGWHRQPNNLQYEKLTETLRYMKTLAEQEQAQNYKLDLTAGDLGNEFRSEAYMRDKLCNEFVNFMQHVDFPLFSAIRIDKDSMTTQAVVLEFIEKLATLEHFNTTIVINIDNFDRDFTEAFIDELIAKIGQVDFCCDVKLEVPPLYEGRTGYRNACLKIAAEVEKNKAKARFVSAFDTWERNKQYTLEERVDENDSTTSTEFIIADKFKGKRYKVTGASDNLVVNFSHALEQGHVRATDHTQSTAIHTAVSQAQNQSHQYENGLADFAPDELITKTNFRNKFRDLLKKESKNYDSLTWKVIILYIVKKYQITDLNQIHKIRAHFNAHFNQSSSWRQPAVALPIFPGNGLEQFTTRDLEGIPPNIQDASTVIDAITQDFLVSIFGDRLDRIGAVSPEAFKKLISNPGLMQADFNEFHLPAHFYIQRQENGDKVLSYNESEPMKLASVQGERNQGLPIVDMPLRHYYLLQDLESESTQQDNFFKKAWRADLRLSGQAGSVNIEDYEEILQDLSPYNQALLQALYTTSPFELCQFFDMLQQLKARNAQSYESFKMHFLAHSVNFADFTKMSILEKIFQTATLTETELSWWNGLLTNHYNQSQLTDFDQLWQGFLKFKTRLVELGISLPQYPDNGISSTERQLIIFTNREGDNTTDMLTLMDRILVLLDQVDSSDRQLQFDLITTMALLDRLPLSHAYYDAVTQHGYRFCTNEMQLNNNTPSAEYRPEKQMLLQYVETLQQSQRPGADENGYKQLFYRYVASQENGLTLTQAQSVLESLMPQLTPMQALFARENVSPLQQVSFKDKARLANLIAFNPALLQINSTQLSKFDIAKMAFRNPVKFRAIGSRFSQLEQQCQQQGCSLLDLDKDTLKPIFNDLCALPDALRLLNAGESSHFDEIQTMVEIALIVGRDVTTPLQFVEQLLMGNATQITPNQVKAIFFELMLEPLPEKSVQYLKTLLTTRSEAFLSGLLLKRNFQPDVKFKDYLRRLEHVLPSGLDDDSSASFTTGVLRLISLLEIDSDKTLPQLKTILNQLKETYGAFRAAQLLDFYVYWCQLQTTVSDGVSEDVKPAIFSSFMHFTQNVLQKCPNEATLMDLFGRDESRVYQCLVSNGNLLSSSPSSSETSIPHDISTHIRNVTIAEDAQIQFPMDETLFPNEAIRTNIRLQAAQYQFTESEFQEYIDSLSKLSSYPFIDINVFLKPLSVYQAKEKSLSFLKSLQAMLRGCRQIIHHIIMALNCTAARNELAFCA